MFEYKPHFIPSAIYVVGCGGTGSRLVPLLAQLVKTTLRSKNPLGWIESLPIFLVDDDVIEPKNLTRQNFVEQDVGQKKSIVLANRYGRGFDIPIYPSTQRIGDSFEKLEFMGENTERFVSNIILVLAVDSAEARRTVLEHFNHYFLHNMFVLDAGNEDDFGQVRFYTDNDLVWGAGLGVASTKMESFQKKLPKMVPSPLCVNYIPYPRDYYLSLGSSASEKSCADLDQTLSINAMMATLMCGVIQNFLYIKPMNYHEIKYNLNGSVSTTLNTVENWFSYATRSSGTRLDKVKYIFDDKNIGETTLYYNHVISELDKRGLVADKETGAISLKPAPIPEVVIPAEEKKAKKSPIKKIKIEVEGPISFPNQSHIMGASSTL